MIRALRRSETSLVGVLSIPRACAVSLCESSAIEKYLNCLFSAGLSTSFDVLPSDFAAGC